MFIINITYKKPLTEVERFVVEHRAYLQQGYDQNFLVASGPKNPRTGGIIISNLQDKEKLTAFLAKDPFKMNDIADYDIIEFDPVKFHKDFESFIAK